MAKNGPVIHLPARRPSCLSVCLFVVRLAAASICRNEWIMHAPGWHLVAATADASLLFPKVKCGVKAVCHQSSNRPITTHEVYHTALSRLPIAAHRHHHHHHHHHITKPRWNHKGNVFSRFKHRQNKESSLFSTTIIARMTFFSQDHAWKARPGLNLAAAAIWALGSERLVTWGTCALIGRTAR